MSETHADQVAIIFELEPEDGYPPIGAERIWATPFADSFVLDNIPLFADGFALGDRVAADRDESGELIAGRLIESAGHTAGRILFEDPVDDATVQSFRRELRDLGCESEFDRQHGLVALDIPPGVSLADVEAVLNREEAAGRSSWWLGVLRH